MLGPKHSDLDYQQYNRVERCWLCGVALPTAQLVPDGGRACADLRWYCRDVRACTSRWTRLGRPPATKPQATKPQVAAPPATRPPAERPPAAPPAIRPPAADPGNAAASATSTRTP